MTAPRAGTGIALSLLCLAILGVMPIISESRPADFDALGFAFWLSVWQFVFAIPLFAAETRAGGKGLFGARMTPAQKRRTLIVGLSTGAVFGLSTFLYVYGIEKAGAVSAAIAIQAYPLFAILWETVFLKRRKTRVELALTGILVVTLAYLATGGTFRVAGFSPWFLVALAVPFLWSIAHVVIKEELAHTPVTPAQITFFRVGISAVFLGLVLAVADPAAIAAPFGRLDFVGVSLLMGLVYYLELIVWFYAVRSIDVSLASSITTPWPALTMVLSVLFLGERVEGYQIGAFLVVAACVYGLMLAGIRKQAAARA